MYAIRSYYDRREFLSRAAAMVVVGGSALAMAESLLPNYAQAQTISFTDTRLKGSYVTYPSPGGNSGTMRGYLVQPAGNGPFPAVLVVHENRGLNPYIEDVARRLAVEGFLALAPDGLYPLGGYPGNDDDGRAMQMNVITSYSIHYTKLYEIPGNPPGDLLLTLRIVLPPADTPKARELYATMARELPFDPRRSTGS